MQWWRLVHATATTNPIHPQPVRPSVSQYQPVPAQVRCPLHSYQMDAADLELRYYFLFQFLSRLHFDILQTLHCLTLFSLITTKIHCVEGKRYHHHT